MTEWAEDGPVEPPEPTVEQRLARIERKLDNLMQATGTHERERPDGRKVVKSRLIKLDWRFAVSVLGAASGIGFTYRIIAPAVIDFLLNIHHALLQ